MFCACFKRGVAWYPLPQGPNFIMRQGVTNMVIETAKQSRWSSSWHIFNEQSVGKNNFQSDRSVSCYFCGSPVSVRSASRTLHPKQGQNSQTKCYSYRTCSIYALPTRLALMRRIRAWQVSGLSPQWEVELDLAVQLSSLWCDFAHIKKQQLASLRTVHLQSAVHCVKLGDTMRIVQ